MELVALLGTDKESWGQVLGLINHQTWNKIFIVRSNSVESFPLPEHAEEIIIELKKEMQDKLKTKLSEFEACLSIASGNGKEHMALISALLSIPLGIRLVAFTKNGVEFIN